LQRAGQKAAVRIYGLVKGYGRELVLEEITLEVARGEAFGLVGANGAGKTTLMRCMLDLVAHERGRVTIFGVDAQLPAARECLAYLPERFVPPRYLRGGEFLRAMAGLAGAPFDAVRTGLLLDELALDRGALERPVKSLSKGMTQKLGLAAVFLAPRELYVLDEPMSGLDPAARVAVKSVLERLRNEGRTLFFTSHVLSDVEELCSSIGVLERGRLRFRGPPGELCARYAEPSLERAFMRCIRDEPAARLA